MDAALALFLDVLQNLDAKIPIQSIVIEIALKTWGNPTLKNHFFEGEIVVRNDLFANHPIKKTARHKSCNYMLF